MTYSNITALAPQNEEFTPEAVNEGVWLTEAHLASVETALQARADEATAAQAAADEARRQRDEALQDLSAANEAARQAADAAAAELATANSTAAQHQATIEQLQTELATLRQQPAADITNTRTEEDQQQADTKAGSYATSDDNPLNRFADSVLPKAMKK